MNKPKYQIGDKVWMINKISHKAEYHEVRGVVYGAVTLAKEQWLYCLGVGMIDDCNKWYSDDQLFPSKQELLNSL